MYHNHYFQTLTEEFEGASLRYFITCFQLLLYLFILPFFTRTYGNDSLLQEINPLSTSNQDSLFIGSDSVKTDENSKIYELDKIIVVAQKKEKQLLTAQSLSVIKASEWAGTNKSLPDIIAEQTGVQTRSYGGTGSYQTVSIRGVQGSEVLILLDGIPLNSAMGGAVDLGKINPAIIDEIEIYKGVTPAEFGGNSLGGVINLKRKKNNKGKSISLSSTIGAYGFQNHLFSFGQNLEKMDLYGSLSFERSDNDFKYLDRNSTIDGTLIDPTLDDTVRRFENNQYVASQVMVYPKFYLNEFYTLHSGLSFTYNNNHIPAPEGRVNKTAQYTEKNFNTYINLKNEDDKRNVSINPGLYFIYKDGASFSTSIDQSGFSLMSGKRNSYLELRYVEKMISVPVHLLFKPASFLDITSLVTLTYNDFNPLSQSDYVAIGDWHSKEVNAQGALDVKLNFGPFGFSAGGSVKGIYAKTDGGFDYRSYRKIDPSDTIISIHAFSSGLNYRPVENILLYCNGGMYSNAPTLRERYGSKGGVAPNPDLKPETGYTGDIGCKLKFKSIYADIAGFYNRSKNTIILHHNSFESKPLNTEGAIVYGSEMDVNWDISKYINIQAKSTVQKTKNLSNGKRLPNEPAVSIIGKFITRPLKGVTLNYWADFKSVYYRDPANTSSFRVPVLSSTNAINFGQLFHNINIEWVPQKNISLSFSARNLTRDNLSFDEAPHPMEGEYSWILYPTNTWAVTGSYSF